MRYPVFCKNVLDVTKPPYLADNTGKTDCTAALIRALDDALRGTIPALAATNDKLLAMSENLTKDAYIGVECGRVVDGLMTVTMPEFAPEALILYFPAGTYRVSDTVTYSLTGLSTRQQEHFYCELCRNIHLVGESRENTVIRLTDAAPGFAAPKPVISFDRIGKIGDNPETTNCAQMNTLEELTVDTGRGNPGAIGVLYVSSNCGRIENVTVRGENGHTGIYCLRGTEGVFRSVDVSGFAVGLDGMRTSPLVLENVRFARCGKAAVWSHDATLIVKSVDASGTPGLVLRPGEAGRYIVCDRQTNVSGDTVGNHVLQVPKSQVPFEIYDISGDFSEEDCAFVDDFGAIGDGVTDAAQAIQRAMDSGKSVVLFGKGTYCINQTITVPATVKLVDFLWCNLSAGENLASGKIGSAFAIREDGAEPLKMQHLMTHEQFSGYFRFIRHEAKRDVIFKDLALIFCAVYENTVPGSRVIFDNVFQTNASYSENLLLQRRGYTPLYSGIIPFIFRGQRVFAENLNAERADCHILNDGSDLTIFGYKNEGPGISVKSVNGGKTKIFGYQAAFWNTKTYHALFEKSGGTFEAHGLIVRFFNTDKTHSTVSDFDGVRQNLMDAGEIVNDYTVRIDEI